MSICKEKKQFVLPSVLLTTLLVVPVALCHLEGPQSSHQHALEACAVKGMKSRQ